MATAWRPLRVLVVDDSAMIRKLVRLKLQQGGRLEVVGVAASGEDAIRQMVLTAPEVMLLDEHLPGMNGSDFLRKLMSRCPIPAVIFSGRADDDLRRRAKQWGASAVVQKPGALTDAETFWSELQRTLIDASRAPLRPVQGTSGAPLVIGIAVSTGGPAAMRQLIAELPANLPPIVVVQHMRDGYIAGYAAQLDHAARLQVRLARDGESLQPGVCYVAPNGHQTLVVGNRGRLHLKFGTDQPVSGHVPSGDALLSSIACTVGSRAIGVVLTGMGNDGAAGLLTMRRAGCVTIAQDEHSSTVYGMPKAAAENGAARHVLPLSGIPNQLVRAAYVHA